ncbi:MAG TPA: hypothetical protein VFD21_13235 [Vicinamibacterales bacterium]|jgi:hypothetical protein|nr:hypothetical protein [Vicinamibacterales bacterium]
MSNVPPNRTGVALNERAIESLEFIRTTMARSAPFTAVSGAGGIAMGVLALVAAAFARSSSSNEQWLTVWVACAAVAVPVGFVLMRAKARRHDLTLWSAAGRRFAQGFVPAIAAGAVLTFALVRAGAVDLVPAVWLLLYGAGVLAGSSSSVPVLAWLGALFMVLGSVSLFTPSEWRDLWLASGFGVLQIAFGAYIARNHGG